MSDTGKWLSTSQVAERLSTTRWTVHKLIEAGEFPVINISTGSQRPRLRISETALAEFIAARAIRTAA